MAAQTAFKIWHIQKSFKMCCIRNAVHGTKDDILWQEVCDDENKQLSFNVITCL